MSQDFPESCLVPHLPIHPLHKPSAIFWHPQFSPALPQSSPGNPQPPLLCHFSSVGTYFKHKKRISIKTIDSTCKYWLGEAWQCPDCSCKGTSSTQALNPALAAQLHTWPPAGFLFLHAEGKAWQFPGLLHKDSSWQAEIKLLSLSHWGANSSKDWLVQMCLEGHCHVSFCWTERAPLTFHNS